MTVKATYLLIDTNVLVYAHDPRDQTKQDRAIAILAHLAERQGVVLSTQVLAEFFVATTRRLPEPLTADEAQAQVERFLRFFPILDITGAIVLEACRGVRDHGLSFWDAQIWGTARLNGIPLILSEDFSDGRYLEAVRFRNPFAASFDLAELS